MIVGLDDNGAGKALSAYQAYAADFDGNGKVELSDAIAVFKHVVCWPSPDPQWLFFNQADLTMPGKANLSPGTVPALASDMSSGRACIFRPCRGDAGRCRRQLRRTPADAVMNYRLNFEPVIACAQVAGRSAANSAGSVSRRLEVGISSNNAPGGPGHVAVALALGERHRRGIRDYPGAPMLGKGSTSS